MSPFENTIFKISIYVYTNLYNNLQYKIRFLASQIYIRLFLSLSRYGCEIFLYFSSLRIKEKKKRIKQSVKHLILLCQEVFSYFKLHFLPTFKIILMVNISQNVLFYLLIWKYKICLGYPLLIWYECFQYLFPSFANGNSILEYSILFKSASFQWNLFCAKTSYCKVCNIKQRVRRG